jgi:ubiquitin thioesterase protein OTUB1
MVIRDEYLTGSQTVVKKLDWLQENGWDQVWRARGDGDCFYRCTSYIQSGYSNNGQADNVAFTIAYILKILHSSDPPTASKAALASIQRATPSESTHFDPELVSV